MKTQRIPTLEEFLTAPVEEVAKVAPATMIYGVSGTRRQAALNGIEPWSDEYVRWARTGTMRGAELIFSYGVQNLLMVALVPSNLQEVDPYRDQLVQRAKWVIAGDEALADYARLGCRARLLGVENSSELSETAAYLRQVTSDPQRVHTFYWSMVFDAEEPWRRVLAAVQNSQAATQAEAIRALYGEEIPPATLYLAFGKPLISLEVIPPLLIGKIQCYWSQQPGYTLTETKLRTILYDYAYLRSTWHEEKTERAKEALAHRQAWEEGPIFGVGMRLGPFWYPAPMSSTAWSTE
jgi:hypothetical protein